MYRIQLAVILLCMAVCAGVLALAVDVQLAAAQTIPPLPTSAALSDAACRGCHGEKTDVLTLPSGETLPLNVDLAALDASPHSSGNELSTPCTSCHINETRYRYPHVENPAQTVAEYHVGVSQNCENCHYPHLPFHEEVDQSEYALPTCADCHGSHNIARVDEMWETMPDNCFKCHSDRSRDWVADFLTPHPGFGQGAEGYAGSLRCAGCHEDKYFTWRKTRHARVIQDATATPNAIVGNFSTGDPDRPFSRSDVSYTIGGRWKQLYITQTVSNTFEILPGQWNVAASEWVPFVPDSGQDTDWLASCAGCHVTGMDAESQTFREFGVGCESCHGPGAAHSADPENIKPFKEADSQVCGACHSRGESPDGHPYPTDYLPGDTLSDHFSFTADAEAVWADGSARLNHQQYMDWQLGSTMALAPDMSCTTCHAVHGDGVALGQLRDTSNKLCVSCHAEQAALVRHVPFHEVAFSKRNFLCTDCHMPLMATSAIQYDIHNHSLLQPDPRKTIEMGGLESMPNACNSCHTRPGETPQWAAETIAFAREQAEPVTGGFFGPGPTPTSPPPPTPMAAVGQPVVREQVETGRWLRTTAVIAFWIAVVLVGSWLFYQYRVRRGKDAQVD